MKTAEKIALILFIVSFQTHAQWIQTNGPIRGYINVFKTVVDSAFNRKIFACYYNKTPFMSADAGKSWKAIEAAGMYSTIKNEMELIGSSLYCTTGSAIFKSENYGTAAWAKVGTDLTANSFTCIKPLGDSLIAGTVKALLLSPDKGITWKLMSVKMGEYVSSLAVNGGTILAGQTGEIMYSTDRGVIWNKASGIDSAASVTSVLFFGSFCFAIADSTIYRSSDSGKTWHRSDSGIAAATEVRIKINSLYTADKEIYAASSEGVYYSSDYGEKWSALNIQHSCGPVSAVCALGDTILASGFDQGIYRSTDKGKSWSFENSGLVVSDIDVMASDDSCIYANIQYQPAYYSKDKGMTWNKLDSHSYGDRANSLIVIKNYLFKSWTNGSVYRSTDYGRTWKPSYKGLTSDHIRKLFYDGNNIYAGTSDGVFFTDDMGENWHEINYGLTFKDVIDLAGSGPNLYAATRGGEGVYRTTDNGKNWTRYNDGLIDKNIYFMGNIKNYLFAVTRSGVFRFNGSTWSEMWPKIYNISAFASKDNYLFMSNNWGGWPDYGVWVSSDYGATWTPPDTAMRLNGIRTLAIQGNDIYAGTSGKGVFRCPLSRIIQPNTTVSNKSSIREFKLQQNYPNPFNPVTTISYTIPVTSHVKLTVYDMLGKEAAVPVNDIKSEGSHSVRFDAAGLPSGIYIYKFQTEGFTDTKKLIILK